MKQKKAHSEMWRSIQLLSLLTPRMNITNVIRAVVGGVAKHPKAKVSLPEALGLASAQQELVAPGDHGCVEPSGIDVQQCGHRKPGRHRLRHAFFFCGR